MARKGRVTPMSKTQQVGARKISKKTKINDTEIAESIEKNTFLSFNISQKYNFTCRRNITFLCVSCYLSC